MNRSLLNPLTRTTPFLLAGLLLTGYATASGTAAPQVPATPQWAPEQVAVPQFPKITTPEQVQVRDRATARWQTLMAGDFAKAYAFATPAVKKSTTEAAYLARFESKPQWNGAEVVAVTCATPVNCVARVRVDLKIFVPRTTLRNMVSHVDEAWVLDEGQWWLSDDIPR